MLGEGCPKTPGPGALAHVGHAFHGHQLPGATPKLMAPLGLLS